MPCEQAQQLPERVQPNTVHADAVDEKLWKASADTAFDLLSTELEHVTNKKFTEYCAQLPRQSQWLVAAFGRVGADDRKSGRRLGYRVDDVARVNTLGLACLVAYFGGWLRKRGLKNAPTGS